MKTTTTRTTPLSDTFLVPQPPSWEVQWEALTDRFEWIRAMKGVPQDPEWHAEGDVWVHVGMVCEAMAADPKWRALDEQTRAVLFLSALFHDVGKPKVTCMEDGRWRSKGHSKLGMYMARELLWHLEIPMALREQVASLTMYHQSPFHFFKRPEIPMRKELIEISYHTRLDHLAILAEADIRGRVSESNQESLDTLGLFEDEARTLGCWDQPFEFPNDHSRVRFFTRVCRNPFADVYDDTHSEVIVLCGFPGAGKSYWKARNAPDLPVVSFDGIREELKVGWNDDQGTVVQLSQERMREHLRAKRPFLWDATNTYKPFREAVVGRCHDYGARVRIVFLDTAKTLLLQQNADRELSVPEEVIIDKYARKCDTPYPTEAHKVEWVSRGY